MLTGILSAFDQGRYSLLCVADWQDCQHRNIRSQENTGFAIARIPRYPPLITNVSSGGNTYRQQICNERMLS